MLNKIIQRYIKWRTSHKWSNF